MLVELALIAELTLAREINLLVKLSPVAMFSEQQPQGQPILSRIPTQSWYPPSVITPPSVSKVSSRSNTSTQAGSSPLSKPGKSKFEAGQSLQSPIASLTTSFAATFPPLRDKSVEELRKLLTDQAAYIEFLHSLEQVKTLDNLQDDLKNNNIELARQNLEGESRIAELRNQCAIIRTMELAAARENFDRVQMEARNLFNRFRITVLVKRLQEAADQVDEESERLHKQLLTGEIELSEYIPEYKKLRATYHRRCLIRHEATVTAGVPS